MTAALAVPADPASAAFRSSGAMPDTKIRFECRNNDAFHRALTRAARPYLDAAGRIGGRSVLVEAVALLAGAAASYVAGLSGVVQGLWLLPLSWAFGACCFLFALHVAHEAGHGTLSRSRGANYAIRTLGFALVGVNGYLWDLRHGGAHHAFPNVRGCDPDLGDDSVVRLSPHQRWRPWHRCQHVYAPLLYLLVGLDMVFIADFRFLAVTRLGNLSRAVHPWYEYVWFVAGKTGYLLLVLGLPLWLLDLPAWQIVAGYLLMTMVQSAGFVCLIIGSHLAEGNAFPLTDSSGRLPGSFAAHVLATTHDWSPTSRIAGWISGGFNAHAVHHLFPNVHHRHYPVLSRLVAEVAAEHSLVYRRTTYLGALRAHLRHLRQLARPPATPVTVLAAA
jgi:linoleoyl-CoA desaturase